MHWKPKSQSRRALEKAVEHRRPLHGWRHHCERPPKCRRGRLHISGLASTRAHKVGQHQASKSSLNWTWARSLDPRMAATQGITIFQVAISLDQHIITRTARI